DAALMEDELEELHSYCQEVFSRLVRFHQRLSQPLMIKEELDTSDLTFSLESSLELIGRPWLGRSQISLPATPTHLLSSPLERSGRETPVSLMSQCSGSIENIKRVSLILDGDEEQPEDFGLTGLNASDKQSGVIERWELLRAQSRCDQSGTQDPQQITFDLDNIASWLESVNPELEYLLQSEPTGSVEDMEARTKELKEMEKVFCHYKAIILSVNLRAKEAPELQETLARVNREWSRACTGLQQWENSLRKKLICCQDLQEELRCREPQQASLQALWSQLQPNDGAEESDEAQEKLHVTGNKLRQLTKKVDQDLSTLQQRLLIQDRGCAAADTSQDTFQEATCLKTGSSTQRCMQRTGVFVQYNTVELEPFLLTPLLFCRQRRESSPPRSFFYRLLRAAFPLQLLLLLLLLLPCLIPLSESDPSCTVTNNFARSFYPMLHYTNGPPPT
ncbi:hypothetical protein XENOCAPTIV_009194, partial [Xenoophorus captivus]